MKINRIIELLHRLNIFIYYRRLKSYIKSKTKKNANTSGSNPLIIKLVSELNKLKILTKQHKTPCHLFIGLSNSGKTTLLRHGGLNYPLLSEEALNNKGTGGTKDIDIWPSDDAIMLDINGEYMDFEKHHTTWRALASILKKHSRSMPLQSISLAISTEDILTSKQTQSLIKNIKQIITTIYNASNYIIPINLVVTKCDLIPGFEEYFTEYSSPEKNQAFGICLENTISSQSNLSTIKIQLSKLMQILISNSITKLKNTEELDSKHTIYQFPERFKIITTQILSIIGWLQKPNPYQAMPNIKNIHFTSIHQSNYFTKEFLSKYITNSQYTPIPNTQFKKRKKLKYAITVSIAALLFTIVWHTIHTAYQDTKKVYQSGISLVNEFSQSHQASYQSLFQYYQGLIEYPKKTFFFKRLGLYQPEKIKNSIANMLLKSMHKEFLESVARYLEMQLVTSHLAWQDKANRTRKLIGEYTQQVKYYALLSTPEKINTNKDSAIYAYYWQTILKSTQNEMLSEMVKLYFSKILNGHTSLHVSTLWPVNHELLKTASHDLMKSNKAELKYAELRTNGVTFLRKTRISQIDSIKSLNIWRSEHDQPLMFTPGGWKSYVEKDLKTIRNKSISKQMIRKYKKEYRDVWAQALNSLFITPAHSLEEVMAMLQKVIDQKGVDPIIKLLRENQIKGMISFSEIDEFNQYLPKYYQELNKLYSQLQQLASANASSDAIKTLTQAVLLHNENTIFNKLQTSITTISKKVHNTSLAKSISHILLEPVKASWAQLLNYTAKDFNAKWHDNIHDYYMEAFHHRFPFVGLHSQSKVNSEEVSLDEFSEFFRPKTGMLWEFIRDELSPYLKYHNGKWEVKEWLGLGIPFTQNCIEMLKNSSQISNAFFNHSAQLDIHYDIQMLAIPGVSGQTYMSDEQTYIYRNEPEAWQRFTWPAKSLNVETQLNLTKHRSYTLSYPGAWGFFHLLRAAKLTHLSHSLYRARWYLSDHEARRQAMTILFRKSGRHNIFDVIMQHIFTQFAIPRVIANEQRSY